MKHLSIQEENAVTEKKILSIHEFKRNLLQLKTIIYTDNNNLVKDALGLVSD